MRVEKIIDHEARFDTSGRDSQGFQYTLINKFIEVLGQGKS